MVDRIVSGYPRDASSIQGELGFEDKLLVVGEYYHSWIIQAPESVSNELPFSKTDLNVKFVKDLDIYRKIKVRILNGAHTSMVPVGYLYGIDYVKDAMDHNIVGPFIEQVIFDEICSTLDGPAEEIGSFAQETIERFRNPDLQHALISISLNSISKFKTRILPTILDYKDNHDSWPPKLVFAFSALLAFYRGKVGTRLIILNDDNAVLDFFKEEWNTIDINKRELTSFVQNALSQKSFWDQDLSVAVDLVDQIALHLENIFSIGMDEALKQVI